MSWYKHLYKHISDAAVEKKENSKRRRERMSVRWLKKLLRGFCPAAASSTDALVRRCSLLRPFSVCTHTTSQCVWCIRVSTTTSGNPHQHHHHHRHQISFALSRTALCQITRWLRAASSSAASSSAAGQWVHNGRVTSSHMDPCLLPGCCSVALDQSCPCGWMD